MASRRSRRCPPRGTPSRRREEPVVAVVRSHPIESEEVLRDLLGFDPGLRLESYYGERAIFHNPGGVAPLGIIFAAIKDHDGPNDRSSDLSRPGVYRLAFGITPGTFAQRYGGIPARPAQGAVGAPPRVVPPPPRGPLPPPPADSR